MVLPSDLAKYGFLTGAPDYSGLVNTRIDGEVLGEAVKLAKAATLTAFFVSLGASQLEAAALAAYAYARWGDAKVEGMPLLPELDAGSGSNLGPFSLHSMPLHELILYADYQLHLATYKDVPDFLGAFFNDQITQSAENTVDLHPYKGSSGKMFTDMVLSIDDSTRNVLQPLLIDAEQQLSPLANIQFGVVGPSLGSREFLSALSHHFVEMAAGRCWN